MNPTDPSQLPSDGTVPPDPQKPWQKPQQQQQQNDGGSSAADTGSGAGDAIEAGVDGAILGGDVVSGAADTAGGAIEAVGNVAGGAIEAAGEVAGGALEAAGGCADGCGGCSLALLVTLFAAASTAMAIFR